MLPLDHQKLVSVLLQRLGEAKAKNPSYSVRAFAQRLSISHGALSEILSGKRRVSRKMALRFCHALMLDPSLVTLIMQTSVGAYSPRTQKEIQLTADQFRAIADWEHFAVLNLIQLDLANHSPEIFAKRLSLGIERISAALVRLERLGLIKKSGKKWRRTSAPITTSDEVACTAIKAHHAGLLSLAEKKLMELSPDLRDFTSITIPTNPKKLKEAKVLIRDLQNRLSALLEEGKKEEVFVFTTNLFPVSNFGGL